MESISLFSMYNLHCLLRNTYNVTKKHIQSFYFQNVSKPVKALKFSYNDLRLSYSLGKCFQ